VRRPIHILILSLALIAAACGSGADATDTTAATTTTAPTTTTTEPTTTTTAPTTTTTTEPEPTGPTSPLNGLIVEDEELAAQLDRKVVAVKIDNHWNARPQSGIEQADAIYELLVEAGLTRFIALFHHSDSEYVGPMRSGRPTDPTLVRPLNGVLTISGAQPWVQSRIVNAGVPLIGDLGQPVTFRWRGRSAPHNLYTSTLELREVVERRELDQTPPPNMFTWGEFTAPASNTAEEIFFNWSDTMSVTWQWDGTQYLRFAGSEPHNWTSADRETTEQLAADTLVVLFADRYTASGSSGSAVPAFDTAGSGRAIVFAGGRFIEGTWDREDISDVFLLTDADGEEIAVPPGKPWVSVFPSSRTVSW
jgi:hypothetical protein